jgi:DNA adenine methylase
MTDNIDKPVQLLVKKYRLEMQEIAMKNTHHTKMTELLIGRNLEWVS